MKRKRQSGGSAPAKKAAGVHRQQPSFQKQKLLLARIGEKKNIDATNSNTITFAQTTSNLFLLNGCDDGATATTRVGRRITMTSMELRWSGSFAATTAGTSPLRMLVVYDKQTNAAAPAATDVVVVDSLNSMMQLSNSRRFQVLADEIVEEFGAAGPQSFYRKIHRDFTAKGTQEGLNVEFNTASTAVVDSITSGSVYAFFWQNGNIITANPTTNLYSRIRFLDS